MADPLASINIPPFDREAREVAEVWTLRKGSRVASCHLWTHPKRGDIRLTVDGEWHRGQALSDGLALVDLALEVAGEFHFERLAVMALRGLPLEEWSGSKATKELETSLEKSAREASRQSVIMIRLTWVLVALTIAILGLTAVLVWMEMTHATP